MEWLQPFEPHCSRFTRGRRASIAESRAENSGSGSLNPPRLRFRQPGWQTAHFLSGPSVDSLEAKIDPFWLQMLSTRPQEEANPQLLAF